MRKLFLLMALLFASARLWGQAGNTLTLAFSGAPPAGANKCAFMQLANDTTNGNIYFCDNTNAWKIFTTGAGGGTVTSVGINGTANQLTVTGTSPITTSGVLTLSVPSNPIFTGSVNATTGFTVNGVATNNHCLVGNGTNFVDAACPGGGGGVTSVATTAPIAGGTITTTGTISITGLAGGVLAGSSPAFTLTPTLGDNTTAGSLALTKGTATEPTITMTGHTSGTVTVTPQAAAGTPTITWPTTTGTVATTATSPVTLSATTGVVACATCVTSAAALTNTALMTGAALQASVTPSATSTLDTNGNATFAGTVKAGGTNGNMSLVNTGSGSGTAGYSTITGVATGSGLQAAIGTGSFVPMTVGPASVTTGHLATWSGTSGGILADGGAVPAGGLSLTGTAGSYFTPVWVHAPFIGNGSSTTVSTEAANNAQVYWFVLPWTTQATTVYYRIATGVAASHCDVGMYSIGATTLTRLWHTGSLDCSTSSTSASAAVSGGPIAVPAGAYYYAVCSDSGSVTWLGPGNAAALDIQHGPAHTWGNNPTDTCTAGVLPSTMTIANITNQNDGPVYSLVVP